MKGENLELFPINLILDLNMPPIY